MLRLVTPLFGAVLMLGMAAPAEAIIPPDVQCASGQVSITFDDGPSKVNTPKLLEILRAHNAQATFFVQGKNVRRYPDIVRAAVNDGHAVEVHTWDHPQLTKRSKRSVTRQLMLTKLEILKATGVTPVLYRPPYGDTSKRVRAIGAKQQLHEELWTIDTRDWSGKKTAAIRKAALKHLRPHRSNVILMHDGVRNSPATLRAVPGIVDGLRARGYCLVPMQNMTPWAVVTASPVNVDEGVAESKVVPVTLQLDGLAQRAGTVQVQAVAGTAQEGADFQALNLTLTVPRGASAVTFDLTIYPDPLPNTPRELTLALTNPQGLTLATSTIPVTITDNTQWIGGPAIAVTSPLRSIRFHS